MRQCLLVAITGKESNMSISVPIESPKSTAGLWRRLVAAVFAPARVRAPSGADAVTEEARHDVGLDRMHQDYAPCGRRQQRTIHQLHARAERLAAGLPE